MDTIAEIMETDRKVQDNMNDIRELQAQNAHYREKIIRIIIDSGELHLLSPNMGMVRRIVHGRSRVNK